MIVVLTGFSCSGKDSAARKLSELGYEFVVSTTTRPMRDGESQGNPYHFVNDDYFNKLIGYNELIEYREYNTLVDNIPKIWYYGVEKRAVNPNIDYVAVLDIVGLDGFKSYMGDDVVSFFLDVPEIIRIGRCKKRGDYNKPEWDRRAEDDRKCFPKEVIERKINYIIYESELDSVVKIITNAISYRKGETI